MGWGKNSLDLIKAIFQINTFITKVFGLETQVIELRVKFDTLKERVDKLEKVIDDLKSKANASNEARPLPVKREDVMYHGNLLWFKNDPTPYCPTCFGDSAKRIPMQIIDTGIGTASKGARSFKSLLCPKCNYEAEITTPPEF